jgi:nitrate/nitrite transporter NarK
MDAHAIHAIVSRVLGFFLGLAVMGVGAPMVFRPRLSMSFFNDQNNLVKERWREIIPGFSIQKRQVKPEDWAFGDLVASIILGLCFMIFGAFVAFGSFFATVPQ